MINTKSKYNTEKFVSRLTFKANNIQFVLGLMQKTQKFTILEACLSNGIYIPHFCYNKFLQIAGNCRICIVEVEKFVKPIISCLNLVVENLNIFVNSFSIKKYRENVLEFLLINHPLDCPICDQAGECDLQEQTMKYGLSKSRFFNLKKTNFDIYLNNHIKLILNRCILCVRCVRYLREVNIDNNYINILGTIGRGSLSKIHVYKNLDVNISNSINIVDICPVGALTLKVNQFSYRPWELISQNSFDYFDSFGLPIRVDYKNSKIIRILPELDSVFYIESISDLTRLKSKFLNIVSLNYGNNYINSDNFYINNTFLDSKPLMLNLINNCFINFKNINIFFFNLLNKFKFFKTSFNYYLNFLKDYIITNKFLTNLDKTPLILINQTYKFYMFRFFLYLNNINKRFKNIKYYNTKDIFIFNVELLHEKSIIFNNLNNNYSHLNLNVYLIKYLSFFKSVLSFDNLLLFKLLNINNKIQLNFIVYIDYLKILYNNNFKKINLAFFNINHTYNSDSIYNILGINVKSLSINLKPFNFNLKQSYYIYKFCIKNSNQPLLKSIYNDYSIYDSYDSYRDSKNNGNNNFGVWTPYDDFKGLGVSTYGYLNPYNTTHNKKKYKIFIDYLLSLFLKKNSKKEKEKLLFTLKKFRKYKNASHSKIKANGRTVVSTILKKRYIQNFNKNFYIFKNKNYKFKIIENYNSEFFKIINPRFFRLMNPKPTIRYEYEEDDTDPRFLIMLKQLKFKTYRKIDGK